MAGRVEGKIAIVVGGGQTPGQTIGNGRATAQLLAREGATVLVADRFVQSAQDTVDLIIHENGAASACAADITQEDDIRALIDACISQYGRVDILHNKVGVSVELGDAPATDLPAESFDSIVAINLRGMWLTCKYALPHMQGQGSGSIVNISSMAARLPIPALPTKPPRSLSSGLPRISRRPTRATGSVPTSSCPAS